MTDFSQPPPDVRMQGFSHRATVAEALAWLDAQLDRVAADLPEESVSLFEAAGRVLAGDVVSPVDVPAFARAMMDGYAVRAADTSGATTYNRLPLSVVGESMPGRGFEGRVQPGEAVRIMTGAPLPDGADAVLPAEMVEAEEDDVRIAAQDEVSPHKHVGRVGEDVAAGSVVLQAGRVLRPQDVGVAASIGLAEVPVLRRPCVRIVVTGDELIPAGAKPEGHRIADSNGPMLAALVARDGGVAIHPGIVPDRPETILAAMRGGDLSAVPELVLVSGGSSVGQEDHAPALLAEHGELAIHGIAMRPSSPAGMGSLDGRLVFLLPGNPVSCLCAYDFFAGRAVRALGGRARDWPHRRVRAPLGRKIVSAVGRLDYVRVRLVEGHVEPLAVGGASVLSSTVRADGFLLMPPDSEGSPPGAEVEVFLYD